MPLLIKLAIALPVVFGFIVYGIYRFEKWLDEHDNWPPFDGKVILTPIEELNRMLRREHENGYRRGKVAA